MKGGVPGDKISCATSRFNMPSLRILMWHTAGALSLAFVVYFWLLTIDPWKVGWHYPGEAAGFLFSAGLAFTLSILAAWKGSRYGFGATTAILVTLAAVMLQMR